MTVEKKNRNFAAIYIRYSYMSMHVLIYIIKNQQFNDILSKYLCYIIIANLYQFISIVDNISIFQLFSGPRNPFLYGNFTQVLNSISSVA